MLIERKDDKPLRIVGYGRVSTDEQRKKGVSLDAQEDKVVAYCKFVGAELVDFKIDAASGRSLARPNLKRALAMVLRGEADAIAVYSIDRLARSTLGFLRVIKDLEMAKKGFISVREQIDSSTPHGRFTMGILALVAELESDLNASRVREAMAFKRRHRKKTSSTPPYGFKLEGSDLIEIPVQVEVVVQILAMNKMGFPSRKIARKLDVKGIPTPKRAKQWRHDTIENIIRRSPDFFPDLVEDFDEAAA